jgi:drug/metabolite transporter (DMT)-like permease
MSEFVNRWPSAVQAAFWMLIIGTLVTFTLVFSRKISADIHVLEIMFFRSLFALIFMFPWVARRGIGSIAIKRSGIVILRGTLAFIGGTCLYAAAALLPLAEVTAITFPGPSSRPSQRRCFSMRSSDFGVGPRSRWG